LRTLSKYLLVLHDVIPEELCLIPKLPPIESWGGLLLLLLLLLRLRLRLLLWWWIPLGGGPRCASALFCILRICQRSLIFGV
jgi:hypothetical protein